MWHTTVAVVVATVLPVEVHAACPDDARVAAFVAEYRALQAGKGFGPELSSPTLSARKRRWYAA